MATGSNDKKVAIFQWMHHDEFINNPANFSTEENHRLSVLAGREDALLIEAVKAHNSDINDAIFVTEDCLVTCSSDKSVKSWTQIQTGESQCKILSHRPYAVYSMDYCKSKNILAVGGMDGQVNIWNTLDWTMKSISAPKQAAIRTCRINEFYILVAGDDDLGMFAINFYIFIICPLGGCKVCIFRFSTNCTKIVPKWTKKWTKNGHKIGKNGPKNGPENDQK